MGMIREKYSDCKLRVPFFRKFYNDPNISDEQILRYLTDADDNHVGNSLKLMSEDPVQLEKAAKLADDENYDGELNIFFTPEDMKKVILRRSTKGGCAHNFDVIQEDETTCEICKFTLFFESRKYSSFQPMKEIMKDFKRKLRTAIVEVQDLYDEWGYDSKLLHIHKCSACSVSACGICINICKIDNLN